MSDKASGIFFSGGRGAAAGLWEAIGDVQESVLAGMAETGTKAVATLRASMPSSGPATPGTPPAQDSGALRKSVSASVRSPLLGKPLSMFIKSGDSKTAYYAHMLEFGTSRMAARPFFYSGIARAIPELYDHVKRMLEIKIRHRNQTTFKKSLSRRWHKTGQGAQVFARMVQADLEKLAAFDAEKP